MIRPGSEIGSLSCVGVVAFVWVIPIIGIVVTSLRPAGSSALGWWRFENLDLTFDAVWIRVPDKYPLAQSLWVTVQTAGIATLCHNDPTPAAAYRLPFFTISLCHAADPDHQRLHVPPQQVVIIPLFTLWRDMGLIDNILSVLIPYARPLLRLRSIFLVKNFFEDFPYELIEAAKVDGCGPLSTFRHIVLPNSLSPIFAVGILQFLWTWNALLLPMLFLRSNIPLPVLLARISGSYDTIGISDRLPQFSPPSCLSSSFSSSNVNSPPAHKPRPEQRNNHALPRPISRCVIARSISIFIPRSIFLASAPTSIR